jgi:hypothetical protein
MQMEVSPYRDNKAAHSGSDASGFQLEVVLQAGFLIFYYKRVVLNRGKRAGPPRVASAVKALQGVRRRHKRELDVQMCKTNVISQVMKGMLDEWVTEHGALELIRNTKEPFHKEEIEMMLALKPGTVLNRGTQVDYTQHMWVVWLAVVSMCASTGNRKAEVATPNGVQWDMSRASRA